MDNENIKYNDIDVEKVISAHYPDIRKIINTIQPRCLNGELQIKGNDIESKEKLFRSFITELLVGIEQDKGHIINTSVQKMLKFLNDSDLDYQGLYQDLFFDEHIPIWAKIIVNQYSNNQLNAMIPPMHLMAMIYSIIKAGKQFGRKIRHIGDNKFEEITECPIKDEYYIRPIKIDKLIQ